MRAVLCVCVCISVWLHMGLLVRVCVRLVVHGVASVIGCLIVGLCGCVWLVVCLSVCGYVRLCVYCVVVLVCMCARPCSWQE